MVVSPKGDLLVALTAWLQAERSVRAAVLFGSHARPPGSFAAADNWSDIDLHLVTNARERIIRTDWAKEIPGGHFCLQVLRPATGGVSKLTVLFDEGEADLVLVPPTFLRLAGLAMKLRFYHKVPMIREGLNSFSTIMRGGYKFLKGEKEWGWIYREVVSSMPGYRIVDAEIRKLADVFLCDLLWVLKKIERGEYVAAQRILHRVLHESNVLLLHELRTRQNLPTFQQARRAEQLLSLDELRIVQCSARLEHDDLHKAAWRAFDGLKKLMLQLVPAWQVPVAMHQLLAAYGERRG